MSFKLEFEIERKWLFKWRRGWDSNPRSSYPDSSFRDCPIRPLSHLSDVTDLPVNREPVRRLCSTNSVRSLPCRRLFCNG